jgi:hypothetical protein
LNYVLVLTGSVTYLLVLGSIARTLVIPRGRIRGIRRVSDALVEYLYRFALLPVRRYERRDSLRASQPAVVIFVNLLIWITLLLLALTLLLYPGVSSLKQAVREAGASLLTLGFTSTPNAWATAVDFIGGFTGLTIVALQISFLPTLYAAFARRETEVSLLTARAGQPPWGPEMLARTRVGIRSMIDSSKELADYYHTWERWAADVEESHSTYPILLRFRSPNPYSSWLVAMLAVLDSAALFLALAPSEAPVEARLFLRMGFLALRSIGRTLRFDFDEDPSPNDPIDLSFEEFQVGIERILEVGFPVEVRIEQAWRDFRGWRVNYERLAYRLAKEIDAVPAPWSGVRRRREPTIQTIRVRNRTPDNPSGI